MNNKIAFPELVQLIAESTGTTERMSELFLKELFATVSEALIAGQKVTVKNLGTFETAADSSGHARLSFTPDKALAAAVNQPFAAFESIVLSDELTDDMLRQIDEGDESSTTDEPATPAPEVEAAVAPIAPIASLTPPPFAEQPEASEPEVEPEPEVQPEPEPTSSTINQNELDMKEEEESHVEEQYTVQHYIKAEYEQEKNKIAHHSFIKGFATGVVASLVLGLIIWGAWNGGRNSVLSNMQPAVQADTIAEPTSEQIDSPQVTTTNNAPVSSPAKAASGAVVTDTCTATMYLSKMATKHYGKPDFWIYIYEENRDKISDPNNVNPGTVVVIPPASKYGIDANDKASIDSARKRTYELLSH